MVINVNYRWTKCEHDTVSQTRQQKHAQKYKEIYAFLTYLEISYDNGNIEI